MLVILRENEIRYFTMEATKLAIFVGDWALFEKNGGNFKICFVLYENKSIQMR